MFSKYIYVCNKYLPTSTYIFRFASTFIDTTTVVVLRYRANSISGYFI